MEDGNWDTHRNNTMSLRQLLVPAFDQAIPALLGDLSERGLLDSTLVVISTEFGRTPRINVLAGRDHWQQAFTICMAGAELKMLRPKKQVYGLLAQTRLDNVFECFEDEQAAIRSFKP